MTYKRLKRTTIYTSEWVNLYSDRVEIEGGEIIEKYHQLEYPKESVSIIVRNKDKVCLMKSYRYTTDAIGLEIPAGYVEPNEKLETAALREVYEETGLRIDNAEFYFKFYPSNGISKQLIHVFIANTLDDIVAKAQHEGIMEVFWINFQEIPKYLTQMNDGISMLALSRYFIEKQ